MKLSSRLLGLLTMAFLSLPVDAFTIGLTPSNLTFSPNDELFADSSGTLLSSGVATMGYFPSGFSVSTSLSISVLIGNYTVAASNTIGNSALGVTPGYAAPVDSNGDSVQVSISATPLLGRPLFAFIGNGSTLSNSTEVALFDIANIQPGAVYEIVRGGSAPIFGNLDSTPPIDVGIGDGALSRFTIKLVAIPEPSTLWLGVIGFASVLRRRR